MSKIEIIPEKEKRDIVINVPGYRGNDRRESTLVVGLCDCHLKHSEQIKNTIADVDEIKEDKKAEDKKIREDHKQMWDEMRVIDRRKVSNKLFYIFITVYSAFFIGGMTTLYAGMHKVDKSLTEKIAAITTEVKVELKGQEIISERIERDIERLVRKVGILSGEVRKNGNGHKNNKEG